MSDITRLTNKILQDARIMSNEQLQNGAEKIQAQEEIEKAKLKENQQVLLERFDRQQQQEFHLQLTKLESQTRNQRLLAKQEVLDALFQEAAQELQQLSPAQFNDFVATNFRRVPLEGHVEMILGERSQAYLNEETRKEWPLMAQENTIELTISECPTPRKSGFYLRQGAIEYNFTFEALLAQAQENLGPELLQMIFEEE